jgi:hypothetical protein
MNKISIKESELRMIIQEMLGDQNLTLTPTETKLKGVFGRYEPEVSDEVVRYMRKNPRSIIKRLMDIYGEKFFTMVDREKQNWSDTQGPLDEQVRDEDNEFFYDAEAEKRNEINTYIKYMIPIVKGEEEFDSSHLIEVDFYHHGKLKVNMDINLTMEIPDTGNPKFDRIVAREAVRHILNNANEGMDRNELKINSIDLK